MTYAAKILADSISSQGIRLTTLQATFPRIVLAEANTHRQLTRSSASSRAIPVEKMLRMLLKNPYMPPTWGKNQKGMQAGEDLGEGEAKRATNLWLDAMDAATGYAKRLLDTGVHKQLTNRLLEPFMWHTAIFTATEWSNFFHLRNHPAAHPDIQTPARLMLEAMEESTPKPLGFGDWHLPLFFDEDREAFSDLDQAALPKTDMQKISVARCARISYLTHDGKRDLSADLDLYKRLLSAGHMSPLEHVARPMYEDEHDSYWGWDCLLEGGRRVRWNKKPDPLGFNIGKREVLESRGGAFCGNFNGWIQHRKLVPNEYDILGEK